MSSVIFSVDRTRCCMNVAKKVMWMVFSPRREGNGDNKEMSCNCSQVYSMMCVTSGGRESIKNGLLSVIV